MTEAPLPGAYRYGFVSGRVIGAVGDLTSSGDPYPDAHPVSGAAAVKMTPAASARVTPSGDPAVTTHVVQEPILADLDADGYLSVNGQRGAWLYVGVWTFTFRGAAAAVPPITVEVSETHTVEAPLDLFAWVTPTPDPKQPVNVLVVPAGAGAGQVLGWDGSQLVWTTTGGGGGGVESATAATLAPGSQATADLAGGVLTIGVPRGDKGDPGADGLQGAKGDKGDPGADGAAGVAGVDGRDGAANVQLVNSFDDVTAPVYGTLYVQVT